MKQIVALAICGVLVSMQAWASDQEKFPLRDEFLLGRVFMTPAERWALDQTRRLPPVVHKRMAGTSTEAEADTPPNSRHAMGYIIPNKGTPSAWQDGEFKEISDGRDPELISFPGSIRIIRHVDSTGDDTTTTDDDSDTALASAKPKVPANAQED